MELVFATGNENKVKEIQKVMPEGIVVKSLKDIGCTEDIPETAPDLQGNALQKVRYVVEKYGVNCFSDDTGLEIQALNGEPGVYSARYAGEQKNSEDNMDLVLTKLEGVTNRKAQFRTAVALVLNGEEYLFEGKVEGEIREDRSGGEGFGYDPIFEPENCGRTFAEMTLEEKSKMSHRARAIAKMTHFLSEFS